jgi:hypothetical protein
LDELLRIPGNKGLSQVRQTYRSFVRQIRGVLRVAMSKFPSAGRKLLLPHSISKYQYSLSRKHELSLNGFGIRIGPKTGAKVNA